MNAEQYEEYITVQTETDLDKPEEASAKYGKTETVIKYRDKSVNPDLLHSFFEER